jgi:hypothetical protein
VYALFSGLVFLVVAGAMLGPLVHAVLHRFHAEPLEEQRTGHKETRSGQR